LQEKISSGDARETSSARSTKGQEAVTNARAEAFQFGPYSLDVTEATLRRGADPVPLSPKVFETLVHLVRHAGSLVTHDELMDVLWPDTIVSPKNLTQHVFMLRQALGDGAGDERYLETVPKRGYRFVAPVKREVPVREADGALGAVAILPFVGPDASEELTAFAEGLADRVADVLAATPGARVLSRALSRTTAPRADDPRAAAQRLGADTLVLGELRRSGRGLSFQAELVRANDGTRLLGVSATLEEAGIAALTSAVEASLRDRLGGAAGSRKPAPANEEAVRAYLLGRHYWHRRPRDLVRSIECFRRAIDEDPLFAAPWAGLADTYATMGAWESGTIAPCEAFPRAKAAAAKAAELGRDAAALPALGFAATHFDWSLSEAEAIFRDAVAKEPGSGQAHHWYAHLLVAQGRPEDAFAEGEKARALEPLDVVLDVHTAWHHWIVRQPELALATARRTMELDPRNQWSPFFTGLALEGIGRLAASVESFSQALELSAGSDVMRAARAHALAGAGRRAEAESERDALVSSRVVRYVSPYGIALVHLALGDRDGTFRWLETALAERDAWLVYVRLEPRLDPLRGDPRFEEIVRRVFPARS
jgi:DNA-binding winged helix-turn-helix (wHTH) protein/tetratricopeptide (TPR) repeat protein